MIYDGMFDQLIKIPSEDLHTVRECRDYARWGVHRGERSSKLNQSRGK